MKARTPLKSTRSSTHDITRAITSASRDHDFFLAGFTAEIDGEPLERSRRWTGDHAAAEVVGAVVARTPELRRIRLELHRAIEVRADRAERTDLAFDRLHDDRRFAP